MRFFKGVALNFCKLLYVAWIELDETSPKIYVSRSSKVEVKVTGLPKFEIRPNLRSISSQDMDHQWELTGDFETRDQYKISLWPSFRYRSRVTCHVSRDFKFVGKGRQTKLNVATKLYLIWLELDET